MRAAVSSRYAELKPARQSSAGGVTYVSAACTTGLLRTCNVLRIAGLAVLRNDELFSFSRFEASHYVDYTQTHIT
ncbi:MAG: hypothetical protein LBM98_12120 [Oscillospiraceae bacterium]|nr:hypothetical protein [Oscillospiraceae bacterium]